MSKIIFGFENEAQSRETSPALWWGILELARETGEDPEKIWEEGRAGGLDHEDTLARILELALDPDDEDDFLVWGDRGEVARAVMRNGKLVWELRV